MGAFFGDANGYFITAYICLCLGFILFLFWFVHARSSNDWPKAMGRITHSEIKSRQRLTKNGGTTTLYSADIHYDYVAAGKEYSSSKVSFFEVQTDSRKGPEALIQKFPNNSDVTVYYNPKNPEKSLLIAGITKGVALPILFFLLSIGSMTAVLFTVFR